MRIYIYEIVKAIIDVPFCDCAPSCSSEVALRFQSGPWRRSLLTQLEEQIEHTLKALLDFQEFETLSYFVIYCRLVPSLN
jgi:hypothetical protein